jgi:Rod binding domain-containing protein
MADAVTTPGAPLPMLTPVHRREPPQPSPEVRRVAEEFESVFLNEMLSPMFEGIDTDGLGGGGDGERMFRPMLIEQYANAISRAGGVGVAQNIIDELMRMQTTIQPRTESPDGADR